MRATERNQFRRECEQAEYDRKALLVEQAEEQELLTVAVEVLSHFNLEEEVERFISSAVGLALLANCCNYAAKCHDYDLYGYKPYLVCLAANHPDADAWQEDGIVYIELKENFVDIGQVSFHALYGEDEGLPSSHGRFWSEVDYQFHAELVARAWLAGWNKYMIHQKIALLEMAA